MSHKTEQSIIAEGMDSFLNEVDMGQADRTLRQTPKEGLEQDTAADGKPLTHSVSYDLTNKKVVGYRHLSPKEMTDGGPTKERTFELPLDKAKYDKAVNAVIKKHGATAAGAKVSHDMFLAFSKAKDKVLKTESLSITESDNPKEAVDGYEQAKKIGAALEAEVKKHDAVLQGYPRGDTGLTPDHIKNSPEYKAHKQNFDSAFQKLRTFNASFTKKYKKQIQADRSKRFSNKNT